MARDDAGLGAEPVPAHPPVSPPWLPWPLLLAVAAALVRVPFLRLPLTPDEGRLPGRGGQWPGLVALRRVLRRPAAGAPRHLRRRRRTGGGIALRLIGMLAVVVAVLLAGRLGGTPPRSPLSLSSPLLGVMESTANSSRVPLVLGSFLLLVRSVRTVDGRARYARAVGRRRTRRRSGVGETQNLVDGFVVAASCLVAPASQEVPPAWRGRPLHGPGRSPPARRTLLLVLGVASPGGTGPALWDAIVTFGPTRR